MLIWMLGGILLTLALLETWRWWLPRLLLAAMVAWMFVSIWYARRCIPEMQAAMRAVDEFSAVLQGKSLRED